jgi:protein gp37
MGEVTKTAWCDHTFNPWVGCTKVSSGCQFCYAEELMDKRYGRAKWGDGGARVRTSEANWKLPFRWNRAAEKAGVRRRVFCASLADVFEDRPELSDWRDDLFHMIHSTPNLDWLLLTKRPQNIIGLMSRCFGSWDLSAPPAPNVWLGVSVEDQASADARIPHLLRCPAAVRFVSYEPAIGAVDFEAIEERRGVCCINALSGAVVDSLGVHAGPRISWVIYGGESGPHARPCDIQWARDARDQCRAAGVKFFMKQAGARLKASVADWRACGGPGGRDFAACVSRDVIYFNLRDPKGGDPAEWPSDLRIREFPKEADNAAH